MTLLRIIRKFLLVLIVSAIGAGITCGSNLLISEIRLPIVSDGDNLILFWFSEVLGILLLSINYFFLKGYGRLHEIVKKVVIVVLIVGFSSIFWGVSYIIMLSVFCLLNYLYFSKLGEKIIQNLYKKYTEMRKVKNKETLDLTLTLTQADISQITSVTFLPKNGTGFTIKTPNIKRLAVYITTKLEKSTFEAEELRKPFDHVVKHIQSDLSKTDFNLVQGKIEEFVKSGGEVKIEYN